MNLDNTPIKSGIESAVNFCVGSFGLACGHFTMTQITADASMIANIGGALLVLIQLYRTLKKPKPDNKQ